MWKQTLSAPFPESQSPAAEVGSFGVNSPSSSPDFNSESRIEVRRAGGAIYTEATNFGCRALRFGRAIESSF
jgi:hypothetical protein